MADGNTEYGKELIRLAVEKTMKPNAVRVEMVEIRPPSVRRWIANKIKKRKSSGQVKMRFYALMDGKPTQTFDMTYIALEEGDSVQIENLHISTSVS
jgi:hypothetical protein